MYELITTIEEEYLKIPNFSEIRGKEVLITISEINPKNKLKLFFEAAGKIDIDISEINKLREISKV